MRCQWLYCLRGWIRIDFCLGVKLTLIEVRDSPGGSRGLVRFDKPNESRCTSLKSMFDP